MTSFCRRFALERITDEVLERNSWLVDLLCAWQPAGDALLRSSSKNDGITGESGIANAKHLRLAIRNGYCNLYRAGQSIAELHFGRDKTPRASIHQHYVEGHSKEQTYLTLSSGGLAYPKAMPFRRYSGRADLSDWITKANEKVGREKAFVDEIISRNPNTVDLEMTLTVKKNGKKVAVRMDLVTLEPVADRWRVVFWEAKGADDPRIRCQDGDGKVPHVVSHQTGYYKEWLRRDENGELVAKAYQETCRLLVEFHRLAKCYNQRVGDLGPGIVAVSHQNARDLLVDNEPRLLIDDRKQSASLKRHVKRLREPPHGLHVQVVKDVEGMFLERLP